MVLQRSGREDGGETRKAQALTAKSHRGDEAGRVDAYRVPDLRSKGLALRVATDGGKTWDVAYRIKGKGVRRPSLGRYRTSASKRRVERANKMTLAARQGRDLIAEEEGGPRRA